MTLQRLPANFVATREALHLVAERLVAPARKPDNEIALAQTPGGFGTPPFEYEGARHQVRVEGSELVHEHDGELERAEITSLAEGAALLGPGLLTGELPAETDPLGVDAAAAERLADFYAFAAQALSAFRGMLPAADEASEINLWPEHFDLAFEAGAESLGRRANYGGSPGDGDHPEPYLYVGPWSEQPAHELWNASGFTGGELGYSELLTAGDPQKTAATFFEVRREALDG